MKKINWKTIKEYWPSGLVVFIFSVIVLIFAWWQVSPWTFEWFTKVCDSNGGTGCMVYYWKQTAYYWMILKVFIGIIIVLGIGSILVIIKGKNEKRK